LKAEGATRGATAAPRRGGGIAERFKQFDRNGDGKLTPGEFPRADLFKQMDKNADGVVTLDEARNLPARIRRQ